MPCAYPFFVCHKIDITKHTFYNFFKEVKGE